MPHRRLTQNDDDLFRPSLTEADDAVGFDRPWNPWTLVVLTFFFGMLSGGLLLALNLRRLGMRGQWAAVAGVLAVAVVLAAVYGWAESSAFAGGDARAERRGLDLAVAVSRTAAAMALALVQQRRFRLCSTSGLATGNLLWPAVVAVLVGLTAEVALRSLFTGLFGLG